MKLKLGNVILTSLPDNRDDALAVVRFCREHGIYLMLSEIVHRHNHTRWQCASLSKKDLEEILAEAGPFLLGRYAIGEAGGMFYWPKSYVIGARAGAYEAMPPCRNEQEAHDIYVKYIQKELAFERREICDIALFNAESSIVFSLHDEAGIDGLCLELLPGDPRITLSAIRGTAKKSGKLWGVHIAMRWYGGIRMDELWIRRWRSALWTSYLCGAEFIYPESGHLEYHERDSKWFEFNSPELLRIRRELRNLYRFTQVHTRPTTGPRVPTAIFQGKEDGHPGIWNPYVWGQYNNGTEWETSDAEKGWKIYDTLFLREDLFHEHVTGEFNNTGNPPNGQVDIIPYSADFNAYALLLFLGYNRMDEDLYRKLIDYVKNGGRLVIWLSHFDTADRRGAPVKLFRNGDLSELCGIMVTGRKAADVRGIKYIRASRFLQYDFPVRTIIRDPYFIGKSEEAEITVTDPELRILAAYSDFEQDTLENASQHPVLVERVLGKGIVWTVTTLSHPGSDGMIRFAEVLTRTIVKACHTDLEFLTPDSVRWSVYSSGKRRIFYLFNGDSDLTQSVRPVWKGKAGGEVHLPPGAFRVFYEENEILIMPEDSLNECIASANNNWTLETREQMIIVENLADKEQTVHVNGKSFHLHIGERVRFLCPPLISQSKAVWMSDEYLEEPEINMENLSTPEPISKRFGSSC
ncbi:MAG: beta-galactosidase trimerization domain-containing protein [Lentisphaeria bacterium]|nr:beta-galactosidase trimerization domain-containing protein [Lentisphaeria bacterium]